MEQAVKDFLVTIKEWVGFMGKGKYHMKVGGVNDHSPAFIHLDFL